MLHFAPEAEISERLSRIPRLTYITTDLNAKVMMRADIAYIPLPDNSMDVIYCSHVFNMLPDDLIPMKEIHRVLKTKGWALLQVPIRQAPTLEAPKSSTSSERLNMFGYPDMYRIYGPDFKARLEHVGFDVELDGLFESLSEKEKVCLGFTDEKLFVCRERRTIKSLAEGGD
jgi:SAM-dependent methyltransferase